MDGSNIQRPSREDQNLIEDNLRMLRELLTSEKYVWEQLGETDGVRLSRLKTGTRSRDVVVSTNRRRRQERHLHLARGLRLPLPRGCRRESHRGPRQQTQVGRDVYRPDRFGLSCEAHPR